MIWLVVMIFVIVYCVTMWWLLRPPTPKQWHTFTQDDLRPDPPSSGLRRAVNHQLCEHSQQHRHKS